MTLLDEYPVDLPPAPFDVDFLVRRGRRRVVRRRAVTAAGAVAVAVGVGVATVTIPSGSSRQVVVGSDPSTDPSASSGPSSTPTKPPAPTKHLDAANLRSAFEAALGLRLDRGHAVPDPSGKAGPHLAGVYHGRVVVLSSATLPAPPTCRSDLGFTRCQVETLPDGSVLRYGRQTSPGQIDSSAEVWRTGGASITVICQNISESGGPAQGEPPLSDADLARALRGLAADYTFPTQG